MLRWRKTRKLKPVVKTWHKEWSVSGYFLVRASCCCHKTGIGGSFLSWLLEMCRAMCRESDKPVKCFWAKVVHCQCSWCVNVLGVSMFLVLCFVVHVVEKHTGIQWVEVVFLCVFKKIKILFFFKTFIHFVFPTPLPNSISTVICCADGRCPIFKTSLPSTPCCKTRAVP